MYFYRKIAGKTAFALVFGLLTMGQVHAQEAPQGSSEPSDLELAVDDLTLSLELSPPKADRWRASISYERIWWGDVDVESNLDRGKMIGLFGGPDYASEDTYSDLTMSGDSIFTSFENKPGCLEGYGDSDSLVTNGIHLDLQYYLHDVPASSEDWTDRWAIDFGLSLGQGSAGGNTATGYMSQTRWDSGSIDRYREVFAESDWDLDVTMLRLDLGLAAEFEAPHQAGDGFLSFDAAAGVSAIIAHGELSSNYLATEQGSDFLARTYDSGTFSDSSTELIPAAYLEAGVNYRDGSFFMNVTGGVLLPFSSADFSTTDVRATAFDEPAAYIQAGFGWTF